MTVPENAFFLLISNSNLMSVTIIVAQPDVTGVKISSPFSILGTTIVQFVINELEALQSDVT